jgi:hypothetical protein
MNRYRLPQFTATHALAPAVRQYRVANDRPLPMGVHAALINRSDDDLEWVDCKTFPNNITCQECGNSGPGSVRCCRRDDACVVIDPPERSGARAPVFSRSPVARRF